VTWREFFAAAAVLRFPKSTAANRVRARAILASFAETARSWCYAREAAHRMLDDLALTTQMPLTSVQVAHVSELALDALVHQDACGAAVDVTGSADWGRVYDLAARVQEDARRFLLSLPDVARVTPPSDLSADDLAKARDLHGRYLVSGANDLGVVYIERYAAAR
jgi:hypothetical protein